jgi:hypothetical protein
VVGNDDVATEKRRSLAIVDSDESSQKLVAGTKGDGYPVPHTSVDHHICSPIASIWLPYGTSAGGMRCNLF